MDIINFLNEIIAGTEYEGKVYVSDETARNYLLGIKSNVTKLVVTEGLNGFAFCNWLKETLGNDDVDAIVSFAEYTSMGMKFQGKTEQMIVRVPTKKDGTKGTLKDDALAHDFTVNALYIDVTSGDILDPLERGYKDLNSKRLDIIYQKDMFQDKPSRLLEIILLASQLNFGITSSTWFELVRNSYRSKDIPKPTLQVLFPKILAVDTPSKAIRRMKDAGILEGVCPLLYKTSGVNQGIEFTSDVFEYTLSVLDKMPASLDSRWAALLHAIAKPTCATQVKNSLSFTNYETLSACNAASILFYFGVNESSIKKIATAIRLQNKFNGNGDVCPSNKAIKKFIGEAKENTDFCLDLIESINTSKTVCMCKPKQVKAIRSKIKSFNEEKKSAKVLQGTDIMRHFHLSPSPLIGTLLRKAGRILTEHPEMSKEDCLKHLSVSVNA